MGKFYSCLLLYMLTVICAFTQTRPVTGRVTDESGNPLAYASVKIKNQKTGVVADTAGSFVISANTGNVIVVSATGFSDKEFTVGSGNTINISLATASELTTVVVTTALGIQRQAKELGYATANVDNKTLTQAKSVNVQQALNGKVSGLNISTVNSGVFENAKINIRGIRSLTGNNQPMLVVDGAPTPLGYLSSIPPDDVQTLSVLKSAASAAIYGPDAVNGVIVITTKRGGKVPTVTITSTLQATQVSFFPKIQKDFGAGAGEPGTVDQYGNYGYVPYE